MWTTQVGLLSSIRWQSQFDTNGEREMLLVFRRLAKISGYGYAAYLSLTWYRRIGAETIHGNILTTESYFSIVLMAFIIAGLNTFFIDWILADG